MALKPLRINRALGLNIRLKRATLARIEPKFAAEEPLWGVARNMIPKVASNIGEYKASSFASINACKVKD